MSEFDGTWLAYMKGDMNFACSVRLFLRSKVCFSGAGLMWLRPGLVSSLFHPSVYLHPLPIFLSTGDDLWTLNLYSWSQGLGGWEALAIFFGFSPFMTILT